MTANRATARLTGYSSEELAHMNVVGFLSEKGLNLAREVHSKLLRGEAIDEPYDQRLIRRDRTEVLLKLTSSLVLSDGQPVGFQHVARDATEERRMQENLRFYIREITRAQEEGGAGPIARGSLTVQSEPGKGITVVLNAPV